MVRRIFLGWLEKRAPPGPGDFRSRAAPARAAGA
jgi:hypothetical protein